MTVTYEWDIEVVDLDGDKNDPDILDHRHGDDLSELFPDGVFSLRKDERLVLVRDSYDHDGYHDRQWAYVKHTDAHGWCLPDCFEDAYQVPQEKVPERFRLQLIRLGPPEPNVPMLPFTASDGGRADAGYKGTTGDCGVRSAAIVTGLPYKQVYDELHMMQLAFLGNKKRTQKWRKAIDNKGYYGSPRNGVYREVMHPFAEAHGLQWIALAKIGEPVVRVHEVASRWPNSSMILNLQGHYSVLDKGVNLDTWKQHPNKRVYGVWIKFGGEDFPGEVWG